MLQGGKSIEASEVLNSELIRRLGEQRGTLRAQLAEQSSTLLDNHPRIKELKAQIADLGRQLHEEAGKISRSLGNDARVADGRVQALQVGLDQSKKQASSSNSQDVQLRGFEREAKAQRDLLEAYLAKYREATARENIEAAPTDGRIISRATVSNTPAYPKKLPIVLIATLATLLLSSGIIITGELLRISAPGAVCRAFAPAAAVIRRREPVMETAAIEQAPTLPPEPALASPLAPSLSPEAAPIRLARTFRGSVAHGAASALWVPDEIPWQSAAAPIRLARTFRGSVAHGSPSVNPFMVVTARSAGVGAGPAPSPASPPSGSSRSARSRL